MPQFLFAVEIPPSEGNSSSPGYSSEWESFANEADKILKPLDKASYVHVQKNVWLLPVADNIWHILTALSAKAEFQKLSFSVFLLQSDAIQVTKP